MLTSYDEWKTEAPPILPQIEDLRFNKCSLCGEIIAVEDLLVLTPIINTHYTSTPDGCNECLNLQKEN